MASEFHDLLVEQMPRLRAYAMGLTRNRAGADDLLQQTALKAWGARTQFQPDTNFKAWIYRIMRNEHISSFRRAKHNASSIDAVPEAFLAREGDQENKMLTREVLAAMDQLADVQREVLLMNCVSGLSYEEIAEALNCSLGTVKSRLWRARNEMQKLIYGDDAEERPVQAERREKSASAAIEARA